MALFGVKKIEYCAAANLAFDGVANPFIGVAPELLTVLTDLPFVANRATLAIEAAIEGKQLIYTSKLSFVTDADPDLQGEDTAFVVTTNEGERLLLGAPLRPRVRTTTVQAITATAGELTAYTTAAEWRTAYRPMRLPVTAAEPISGPEYDICCGAIKQGEPISGPAYYVCCGEIKGEAEPTLLTVRWLDGDGSLLDSATYYSNQPEPTTSEVPTKASTPEYSYTFDHWQVQSIVGTVKTYEPIFTAVPEQILVRFTYSGSGPMKYAYVNADGSTTVQTEAYSGISDWWALYFNGALLAEYYFKFKDTEDCTYLSADWSAFNAAFPQMHPIYHPNDPTFQIGYYSDEWQGNI